MVWNFQDSYTKLPSIFYSKVNPENFNNKKLVCLIVILQDS